VQVVVQLADDVDADHVAERLDDPQVRVRPVADAPRIASRAPANAKPPPFPHAGRAVEDEAWACRRQGRRSDSPCFIVLDAPKPHRSPPPARRSLPSHRR
jgi:hypothetical protein